MKKISIFALLCIAMSCTFQEHSPTEPSSEDVPLTLKSVLAPTTRSAVGETLDSAYVRSRIQSDKDIFMLNRVVFKNGVYILALKESDAAFLGISSDIYGRYVDYVNNLNEQLTSSNATDL